MSQMTKNLFFKLAAGLLALVLLFFATVAYADSLEATVASFGNSGPNETMSHFCIGGNHASVYANGWFKPAWTTGTWRMEAATYYAEGSPGCMMSPDKTRFEVATGPTTAGLITDPGITLYNSDPADTTPPTISNLTAGSITQTGATITWTTNESATHTIKYGTTSGSYDSYPNTKSAGSGTSASGAL